MKEVRPPRPRSPGLDIDKLKALSHPLRFRALHIFSTRVASPNEVGLELGVDVNKIAYHVRVLAKYDCVELVHTKQRRATKRAVISDEEWTRIPSNFKDDITVGHLQVTGDAITASLAAGVFNARDDYRQAWIPMEVDEQAWAESMEVLAEAEEKPPRRERHRDDLDGRAADGLRDRVAKGLNAPAGTGDSLRWQSVADDRSGHQQGASRSAISCGLSA